MRKIGLFLILATGFLNFSKLYATESSNDKFFNYSKAAMIAGTAGLSVTSPVGAVGYFPLGVGGMVASTTVGHVVQNFGTNTLSSLASSVATSTLQNCGVLAISAVVGVAVNSLFNGDAKRIVRRGYNNARNLVNRCCRQ